MIQVQFCSDWLTVITIKFYEKIEGIVRMRRILNYAGSKWSMAKWLVKQMPEHEIYLEPFFGSGAVFFTKEPAKIETINDIDGNVVNLFKIMREKPFELACMVDLTPYARCEYLQAIERLTEGDLGAINDLERARLFLIRCWMSQGGKTATKTGWRHNISGGNSKSIREWNQLPELIVNVADRLKDVQIDNVDSLELIKKYNKADCLIYADPPYLRSTKSQGMYEHEMTKQNHINFLEIIKKHHGPVIISGHQSELYDRYLNDWRKESYKDKEIVWFNF